MSKQTRLLLIEDDERIRAGIEKSLEAADYHMRSAATAQEAANALQYDYELILLDLGLPDGDGLDLCRSLRRSGCSTPIIILTSRDHPDQRVRGLDAGADDYVVKPYHPDELLARIRSILRRTGKSLGNERARCGELWADPESRMAGRGRESITLKPREFDLLLFLLRFPSRTWTREHLLDRVWGRDFEGDSRTVDLHVRRLRAKVEVDASDPQYIRTVWGVGYRLEESEQE